MTARPNLGPTTIKTHKLLRTESDEACWLRVEDDDEDITIADEDISSRNLGANVTNTRAILDMDEKQAIFVHKALTAILRGRGAL